MQTLTGAGSLAIFPIKGKRASCSRRFFYIMTRGQFKDSEKMRKLKILGTLWLITKSTFTVSEPVAELVSPIHCCFFFPLFWSLPRWGHQVASGCFCPTSAWQLPLKMRNFITSLCHSLDCRHFLMFLCIFFESIAWEVHPPAPNGIL